MGYDLYPSNKELEEFHFGAFSWSFLLEKIGLIIGTGRGVEPGSYSYLPDKYGRDPNSNDGFRVTAKQSKALAMAAQGLASNEKFIQKEWDKMPKEEKERKEKANQDFDKLYRTPIRKDWIERVEKFAVWAYKSRGFSIR